MHTCINRQTTRSGEHYYAGAVTGSSDMTTWMFETSELPKLGPPVKTQDTQRRKVPSMHLVSGVCLQDSLLSQNLVANPGKALGAIARWDKNSAGGLSCGLQADSFDIQTC